MSDNSKIEWTDATWNPITGCSVVSPGCTNCYAMRLAGGRLRNHPSRAGLTAPSKAGPVWNGAVRLNEAWLTQPLRWRRPRMIFVCAHGDLFHEAVPDAWIDRVFAVMAVAPQHVFQVLTKRPDRMRKWFNKIIDGDRAFCRVLNQGCRLMDDGDSWWSLVSYRGWPLPNVWLGVSVEDQTRANERIPILLDTPAAVRWISAEPLLGPVDVTRLQLTATVPDSHRPPVYLDAVDGKYPNSGVLYKGEWDIEGPPPPDSEHRHLDWVVCGGESGPGARPMHPDWVRALRDDCAEAGVPFFFKQWGDWVSVSEVAGPGECFKFPDGATVRRVGKKTAGATLNGVEHRELPRQ
ncbi:MAG: phage Gp37/Gp68 family protein [Sphingomonadales bacterium]|nr:phage Gp37/Gp68 family protein [Sphingomonadales bacterium]